MPKSLIWLHFVVETSINKLLEAFGKFDKSGIKLHPKAFLVPCILVLNLQKKVIRRNLHGLSKRNSINSSRWNAWWVSFPGGSLGMFSSSALLFSIETSFLSEENLRGYAMRYLSVPSIKFSMDNIFCKQENLCELQALYFRCR